MSRTHGFNSPSRRSKRLLASGYYLPTTQSKSDVPSDDDDTASVDSSISRSSFAAENRNVVYEESPTRQLFNRRRRNHSGSPARSPVLAAKIADATVNRIMMRKETHTHRQALVTSEQSTARTSRQHETVASHSHAIQHLYGLQQDEEDSYAGGEHAERHGTARQTNMQVIQGSQASQGDVFKTPTVVRRHTFQRPASSLSDDETEHFETPVSHQNQGAMNSSFFMAVYQMIAMILSNASNLTWKGGKMIYEITTSILLLDTWLMTHGFDGKAVLQNLQKFLKLLFVAFVIAVAAYFLTSLPRLYNKPVRSESQPLTAASLSEKNNENHQRILEDKYSKQMQEFQKSVQQVIEGLEYSMQQLELKIVDRHTSLHKQLEKLETKHQKSIEDIHETSERLSSVASLMGESVSDKSKELELSLIQKLNILQAKIDQVKRDHEATMKSLKQDVDGKFQEVDARHKGFQSKLDQFESYMATLGKNVEKVQTTARRLELSVEQSYANTTYLKDIADKSFTENFLFMLQKASSDSDKVPRSSHTHLALVFLEWLKVHGFVKEADLRRAYENTNKTFVEMVEKFKSETEQKLKVLVNEKSRESYVTLDSIATRKHSQQDLVTETMVKMWIKEALDVYSADRIGMPDYALESAGGFIVNTRCSETYRHKTALVSILGIPIYYDINTPRAIIQPNVLPGDCWAFMGSEGYVVIGLSASIHPTSFTLEHIPKSLALYNNISSAPKDFTVYGLNEPTDMDGNLLGIYRYEENGHAIQTFSVESSPDNGRNFSYIELRIASNWGHKDFTCLYRFRVHGVKA